MQQSLAPTCLWTFLLRKVTLEPGYINIRRACPTAIELDFWYVLSKILTVLVPGVVKIVLRYTQWDPVFRICTNSGVAGTTSEPFTAESWRPSTWGKSLFSSSCPAWISESASSSFLRCLFSFPGRGQIYNQDVLGFLCTLCSTFYVISVCRQVLKALHRESYIGHEPCFLVSHLPLPLPHWC
mgnify:CR=1 FL=1